jgi:non-ribosomal peptide synthetase component F
VQYQDYAEWQRGRMQDEDMVKALDYWRDQLRGAPSKLHLPTDHIDTKSQLYLGRQVRCPLGESIVGELSRLSRQERSSLFMTLLTGFVALLARITGQTDLVVGVPIAGRTRVELSGLIGCCTNTLVLRTDASGNPTFRELLERVRRVSLAAYAHQELPFEHLVRELQPERRLGQHPLFQVLFNYLDFPHERLSPRGVEVEEIEVPSETALVDLAVDIRRADRTLTCSFSCNAGLFEASTVDRLMQDYLVSLESFASNPDRAISTLPDSWDRADTIQTDRLVQELERMTDEEAERLLAAELRSGNG